MSGPYWATNVAWCMLLGLATMRSSKNNTPIWRWTHTVAITYLVPNLNHVGHLPPKISRRISSRESGSIVAFYIRLFSEAATLWSISFRRTHFFFYRASIIFFPQFHGFIIRSRTFHTQTPGHVSRLIHLSNKNSGYQMTIAREQNPCEYLPQLRCDSVSYFSYRSSP